MELCPFTNHRSLLHLNSIPLTRRFYRDSLLSCPERAATCVPTSVEECAARAGHDDVDVDDDDDDDALRSTAPLAPSAGHILTTDMYTMRASGCHPFNSTPISCSSRASKTCPITTPVCRRRHVPTTFHCFGALHAICHLAPWLSRKSPLPTPYLVPTSSPRSAFHACVWSSIYELSRPTEPWQKSPRLRLQDHHGRKLDGLGPRRTLLKTMLSSCRALL